MNKSKIEWTDYTWNPIKGLCPVDCKLPDGKSYCYARRIYKRFTPQWKGWNGSDAPFVLADEFVQLDKLKKPSRIFVCSTFELFHSSVKKHIHWIFNAIEKNPQHTFQILTKFPQNIDRAMPDNVHLGVSVTKGDDDGWLRIYHLKQAEAKIKFVSFEPLLGMLNTPIILNAVDFDWFIFGRLTGFGKKYDPERRIIEPAVNYFKGYKKPVFLKNNLKPIWGENLIQEFPKK